MARENKNWAKAKFTPLLKKKRASPVSNAKSEAGVKRGFRNKAGK